MTEKCNCDQAIAAEAVLWKFVKAMESGGNTVLQHNLEVIIKEAKAIVGGIPKWDVDIAVLNDMPMSYEIFTVVVQAETEEEAYVKAENMMDDVIEEEHGNTHNVAGYHRWNCNPHEEKAHEPAMEEGSGQLPTEG